MNESSWLISALNIATQITTPLALSGLIATLFFYFINRTVTNLDTGSIKPRGVYKLVLTAMSFGFIISVLALVLGISSWLFVKIIGPSVTHEKLTSYILSKNYEQVIAEGEPYINKNPNDDEVRHLLGTSYFATKKYKKGAKLYMEMEKLYSDQNPCSQKRSASLSSIAAFSIGSNTPDEGIVYSRKTLNCDNNTDPYIFNHLKLLAMLNKDEVLTLPNNYKFKSSYFESKYALLKYVYNLKKNKNPMGSFFYLKEAFCEDKSVESFIQNRFNNGDVIPNELSAHDFDYEIKILSKYLNLQDRKVLLKKLNSNICAV